MRLTQCEATTRETSLDHNSGNYVPYLSKAWLSRPMTTSLFHSQFNPGNKREINYFSEKSLSHNARVLPVSIALRKKK